MNLKHVIMRRETPEINAGSMADIAFLLLIFWLVATALKPDRGLAEKLQTEDEKVEIAVPTKASDILKVYVTEDGEYEVEFNGTRTASLEEIEKFLGFLKGRAGFRAKLVISAHYEAPYEAYLLLLRLSENLKVKTIETEIKKEENTVED